MSTFFKNSNNEKSNMLYNKSRIYKTEMVEIDYENLIDFQFTEKYLYGRVAREYYAIEINPEHSQLVGIDADNQDVVVLGFVARAFNDLMNKFETKRMTNEISPNDPYLSALKPKKGYQNPNILYNKHYDNLRSTIVKTFVNNNIKVDNFDNFIIEFMIIAKDIARENPITYPAFLRNRICPMNVSGLVIELSLEKKTDDEFKIINFKQSKNWKFFLNACKSYGFSVDLNNPGTLIADIGSSEMIKYCASTPGFGQNTTDFILQTVYKPAHIDFFSKMPVILLDLYNAVRREYIETVLCPDTLQFKSKVIVPQSYTLNTILKLYTNTYFFNIYTSLRFIEEGSTFTEQEKIEIKRQLHSIGRADDFSTSLALLESIVSQTFDHSGSLTDFNYRVKIRKN
jgi:hypothetical protein